MPSGTEGLAERTERDDFVVGHLVRRLLRARARGDGTGRKRGAKLNWPSVCLSPAGSHGDGLSCVPHANAGVHSNMSDVSVQATVSFIITFRKKNVASDIISSVADKLGSFLCGTASHLAAIGASALTPVTFMQGRSGCCCVGWEGRARTSDKRCAGRGRLLAEIKEPGGARRAARGGRRLGREAMGGWA
jgi:hypothetical protein